MWLPKYEKYVKAVVKCKSRTAIHGWLDRWVDGL